VFVLGALLILAGAVSAENVRSDAWIYLALLGVWGAGGILNAAIRFMRTVNAK
jgi:hypothetical protein